MHSSKGAILADEVGLGKTIEAGIILSELWAEHKRRIIIVVPASLRNQWNLELMEKFYLPSVILENESYKEIKELDTNLFEDGRHIIICSYNFAIKHSEELQLVGIWSYLTKLTKCVMSTKKVISLVTQ